MLSSIHDSHVPNFDLLTEAAMFQIFRFKPYHMYPYSLKTMHVSSVMVLLPLLVIYT
jgi:hypothetical protein